MALAFAREGADVVVTARTTAEIDAVASEVNALGRTGVALAVDLSDRAAVAPLLQRVAEHVPQVDVLVNNAGIGSNESPRFLVDYDEEFWELSLAVNLTAPMVLMKQLLPAMIERGWGRIINIASVAGKLALRAGSAYSATKHGLIGLTRVAALETAGTGVTVNAICPGATRTVMLLRRLQVEAELRGTDVAEVEANVNPMKRLLDPEEIAALAVYLASDDARGMTGQAINISGGSTMH